MLSFFETLKNENDESGHFNEQEMNEAPEHYTIIAPNLMETKQKSNNFIILSASFYRAYFLLPSPVTIAVELTENG